ncbi:hypothetical protein FKM82_029348, partial [Ascaphus truei]
MMSLCDTVSALMLPSQPQAGPPQLSPQELSLQIKSFLSGSDPQHGQKLSPRDHARCSLLLLRCLPPARHAVLEHLRSVFHDSVSSFLSERDSQDPLPSSSHRRAPPAPSTHGLDEVTQEVQKVLEEFIRLNPRAWAPLISAWSIELMGQLSSKHAGRHGVPHSASLNELLQLWMSCGATRALMDIYTHCLSTMIGSCPDACVDALLDTSVQHSPHFDWVVAHIGNSFPSTIISRVLSCGLKDFCAHNSPAETPTSEKRVPKLGSVVGILGHLSSRHGPSIRQEILRMFHDSLRPGGKQQRAALPYLLQLAALSPSLLGTVCQELVDSLKPATLAQLQQHCASLPREELDNMLNLSVHLACQTSVGAPRLLRFLLDTAMPASVITTPGLAVHDSV